MRVWTTAAIALVAILVSASFARAQAPEPLRTYFFGNSLIHHLTQSDETAVPHWIAVFATANGQGFQADGQWGFLRDFAKPEAPRADWEFKSVSKAWTRTKRNFDQVGYDVIVTNPANFIQNQPPSASYEGDNPTAATPISATLAMTDRIKPKRLVIYEGWADLGGYAWGFPPSRSAMAKYYGYNLGAYHTWYLEYQKALQVARPDMKIDLIPVATVLAQMFQDGPLADIPAKALYVDDAPHGTSTLYFLAGAIAYVGLFNTALPAQMDIPDSIHLSLATRYADIRTFIHTALALDTSATLKVKPVNKVTDEIRLQNDAFGVERPSLAMGLGRISDWTTQQPFIDHMKMARTWVGHLPGQWGGWETSDLEEGGFLDDNGWVWGIPGDLDGVEALILTDQPAEATIMGGQYRVTYQGRGTLKVTGRARKIRESQTDQGGEIWFDYTPGDGPVGIYLKVTDPDRTGDYIHDISVVRKDHISLFEAGARFNPDWIARIQDLRSLRFMDWMKTNGSLQKAWADRPRPDDYTYTQRGVPIEVMVDLANQIGADPWLTLPHMSDDAYSQAMATYVKRQLDPNLKVFVEYSNELWNFSFQQAPWALTQADLRWGKDAADDAWMQFAGMRAAQIAGIWHSVFADQSDARLVRVVGTHTDWPGLEKAILLAPLWQAENSANQAPALQFDAYAVSGYFGLELGMADTAKQTLGWVTNSMMQAMSVGGKEGLTKAALSAYVKQHIYDAATPEAIDSIRQGSLDHLIKNAWPYQAQVARAHGLQLVMYEGGSHVTGLGEWVNDDALTSFFTTLNYTEGMAGLYDTLFQAWEDIGGAAFNAYIDVGRPSKWGSWGALRYLQDDNPRFDALMRHNIKRIGDWELRAPSTFQHGATFQGTQGNDRLEGSQKQDFLLGGAGDDALIAQGLRDNLHGGQGKDNAILPGDRGAYQFYKDGPRVIARTDTRRFVLFSIETIIFSGDNQTIIPLTELVP